MRLFNTLGRQVQEFAPIHPPEVGLYTCGPTVYNYAHIGNLRTYVFEDVLRRTLEFLGHPVRHVMNVTDVGHLTGDADEGEDKMILGARREGRTVWDIADFYTRAFFSDLEKLNIEHPTVVARATDHVGDMIALIRRIEEKGYTYFAGGNLYFDISKFPGYGKLAGLDVEGLQAGARIEVDPNKRNPLDFVLWFTRSKFEHQAMLWDSPWGRGYPGWHIECSAMSMKYLGEHFDIHTGGVDHIPVHHTNELAQSEAAVGHKWVDYWVHGEFLVLEKEKMAKSSGKFLTLGRLVEDGFDPLDYRLFCLGAHYRTQLQFSYEALEAARNGRANLVERLARLKAEAAARPDSGADAASPYLESFTRDICEDLNTPRALADFWGLLKDETVPPEGRLAGLLEMDRVLGLRLAEVRPEDRSLEEDVLRLVREREEARQRRDFRRADQIRDHLRERGILLEDTPAGTQWRKK